MFHTFSFLHPAIWSIGHANEAASLVSSNVMPVPFPWQSRYAGLHCWLYKHGQLGQPDFFNLFGFIHIQNVLIFRLYFGSLCFHNLYDYCLTDCAGLNLTDTTFCSKMSSFSCYILVHCACIIVPDLISRALLGVAMFRSNIARSVSLTYNHSDYCT